MSSRPRHRSLHRAWCSGYRNLRFKGIRATVPARHQTPRITADSVPRPSSGPPSGRARRRRPTPVAIRPRADQKEFYE